MTKESIDLAAAAVREVSDLESWLEDWISGRVPASDFQRFEDSLSPGFTIIPPLDYPILDRNGLLEYMERQHGTDHETRRWTDKVRVGHVSNTMAVVFYEEWQVRDGNQLASLITAVFVPAPQGPNGVQCAHIHETSLQAE